MGILHAVSSPLQTGRVPESRQPIATAISAAEFRQRFPRSRGRGAAQIFFSDPWSEARPSKSAWRANLSSATRTRRNTCRCFDPRGRVPPNAADDA
jgi:hypothetical protein